MTYTITYKSILLSIPFVLFVPGQYEVQAQDTPIETEPITIGKSMSIHSEILDEDRRILVYLPNGYENARSMRYPVLYLLDGEVHFHHMTGIVDFLSMSHRIPQMIVVGVTNTDRNRDMTTPTDMTDITLDWFGGDSLSIPLPPTTGGAGNFLRFLTDELVPRIESEYRTAPFRILMGHSFGGLFTLHALLTHPESYQAYLVISPSLVWDDRALIRMARTELANLPLDGRFLYMTAGDQEMGEMLSGLRAFASMVEDAEPEGLRWWYKVMPDEIHPSVVHRTAYDGLEKIFDRYRITEQQVVSGNLSAVENTFAQASRYYGHDITIPERLLNTMGYMQLQFTQDIDKAVEIFRRNAELYPKSANVYDSLADAYRAAGQLVVAKQNYQRAVELAEQQGHENLENYREKLKQVIEQSEER